MRYAIVDIETTGVSYMHGKITEVAILIHDGHRIVDEYSTLINPEQKIPYRITQLTGINNKMVEDAPKFYEVAAKIVGITEDCVFVAHNVSFDYNFMRQEFRSLGYDYQREKLCTVKLSRKLIPYKRSYSLANLCRDLHIENLHPHRALGDAKATAKLFEILLAIEPNPGGLPLQGFNSSLSPDCIRSLPEEPGVYYFLDENQNIIYIGKSKNIRSRVVAHITNCTTKRALEMKNKLFSVDFELTGNELVALLLESHEIHKHKPLFNRAQRRTLFNYGLYHELDDNGYLRLSIRKIDDEHLSTPLTTFDSFVSAKNYLFAICDEFQLCQKLCGLNETKNSCFLYKLHECKGACIGEENPDDYNDRVQKVLDRFAYARPDFLIIEKGRAEDECAVIRVENNRYLGFGFTYKEVNGFDPFSYYSNCVKAYPENKYVHSIIRSYLDKNPKSVVLKAE